VVGIRLATDFSLPVPEAAPLFWQMTMAPPNRNRDKGRPPGKEKSRSRPASQGAKPRRPGSKSGGGRSAPPGPARRGAPAGNAATREPRPRLAPRRLDTQTWGDFPRGVDEEFDQDLEQGAEGGSRYGRERGPGRGPGHTPARGPGHGAQRGPGKGRPATRGAPHAAGRHAAPGRGGHRATTGETRRQEAPPPRGSRPRPEQTPRSGQGRSREPEPRAALAPRVPPIAGEALYGINPVQRALESGRRVLRRLYLRAGRDSDKLAALRKLALERALPVFDCSPAELDLLCSAPAHQGAVLACGPLPVGDEAQALALPVAGNPLLVVLDQVEDPQNVGAVGRNAAAFGAAGIIVPRHHAAPFSPAASKASAGELETFPLFEAVNLSRFLEGCKERGYWVVGAVSQGGMPLADLKRDSPLIVVLGNEGRGLRPLVERHCDLRVTIPLAGVGSLNVASASAILLHHLSLGAAPPAGPAPTPVKAQGKADAEEDLDYPLDEETTGA